ncbi:magnesium or manganese-dependent protein phosphatase, partial [Streptomyces pristinaespiralis ATCC 25486]
MLDDQLTVVRADGPDAAAEGAGHLLGRPFTEVYRLDEPHTAEGLLREVLISGRPATDHVFRGRRAGEEGPDRRFLMQAYRLDDHRGRSLGRVLACMADVTQREKARRRK